MKFSELNDRQAQERLQFYLSIMNNAAQEQRLATTAGIRLLLLGNAAGTAIIAGVLTGIYGSDVVNDALLTPLVWFLSGIACAGMIYFMFMISAASTAAHVGNALDKVINDQLPIEQLTGWQLNRLGQSLVVLAMIGSIICLVTGTVMTVKAL